MHTPPLTPLTSASFRTPPSAHCLAMWWGWNGPMDESVIARDIDRFHAMGVRAFLIEAGYGMTHPYLSPEWFNLTRHAVLHAKQRGMGVWIEDEGKYPSGFAGGKFTLDRPDLCMQVLLVARKLTPAPGEQVEINGSGTCVGALAVNLEDQSSFTLPLTQQHLSWTTPSAGRWEVQLIEHQFRTSPTRCVNHPDRAKDQRYSLMDYLNPAATAQFLAWVHEGYYQAFGAEFGNTFLGFMSDEPDFGYTPWTPRLPEEFRRRKGYDIRPFLPDLFAPQPSPAQHRLRADYWDVWSDLFRASFFTPIADWCQSHRVQYIAHLNSEDVMPRCVRSQGDYFKCMRPVHMPGIDTIWDQIWPGKTSNFPKLASSAAHLAGRPRAFSESFAAYKPLPDVDQARWILNHQLVRGINQFLIMYFGSSAGVDIEAPYPFLTDPRFTDVIACVNRASHLLSVGSAAASIGLYHPTSSLWLGDADADVSALDLARQLLEHQRDFDFMDDHALTDGLALEGPRLVTPAGQAYSAVLLPSVSVLSQALLERLRLFASAGGYVCFLGRLPALAVRTTYRDAEAPSDLSFAQHCPSGLIPDILPALPAPDLSFDRPCPHIKYVHRRWPEADVYFLFNESDQPQALSATFAGAPDAWIWDAQTGSINPAPGPIAIPSPGKVRLPLDLPPAGSVFLVFSPAQTL